MKRHIILWVLALCAGIHAAVRAGVLPATPTINTPTNTTTTPTTPTINTTDGCAISGHVIEAGTEEDLPFARVEVAGLGLKTTTDEAGHFLIRGLKPGKHTLRVSSMGYKTMEKTLDVSREFVALVHFPMEPEEHEAAEVVVSANRNATRRTDAPVVVNVMGQKLFDATGSTDLAQALPFQAGLRVENNCQNCTFPQVRVNGLEGPYSQILINSRPVMSALGGVYGLEQIPTDMIERVEVVRGGGSALFGSGAVGGTINIITRDPVENSFRASSTLSSLGGKSWAQHMGAGTSLVSKDSRYGMALYESYRHRNPYDHDGDGFSELGKLRANTFGLRAYYRPTHLGRLDLEYHTTSEFRRGGNAFGLEPHQSDIAEQATHSIHSGGMSYSLYSANLRHKLNTYAHLQHISRQSYYGTRQDPNAYGRTRDLTLVAGAQYSGQMERCLWAPATFTGGVEYHHNGLRDVMPGYQRDMEQNVHTGSLFAQNEWQMGRLTLLAGLRADRHSLIRKLILSPRVNLLFKPTPNLQTRLTYGTGFRAPQAYDEDLHVAAVGGEGVLVRLSPNLREERSHSLSGSADWALSLGNKWQANLLAEAFFTQLSNVFVLEDTGRDEQGHMAKERRNGSGARVWGANIDARLARGRLLALQLGFTAQQSRYLSPEVWATTPQGLPRTTRRMPRAPDFYGYFTLTSEPLRNLSLALSGTYTGPMIVPHMEGYVPNDRMEHTPSFVDVNLKADYTFLLHDHIRLTLQAGVQNILGSFQKDLDRGPLRDSGYFYGPTQPRTLFVGFKVER